MTFAWSVLRAWGFTVTVPLALALGVAGAVAGSSTATIPMVRLPVPAATLLPVVSVLVLSWTLHDRYADLSRTAVRDLGRTTLTRFGLTVLTCVLPALLGAVAWGHAEPVSISATGVALTALLSLGFGSRVWGAVLVGGYLWLRYAASRPVGDALPADALVAVLATAAAGAVLAVGERRRARG